MAASLKAARVSFASRSRRGTVSYGGGEGNVRGGAARVYIHTLERAACRHTAIGEQRKKRKKKKKKKKKKPEKRRQSGDGSSGEATKPRIRLATYTYSSGEKSPETRVCSSPLAGFSSSLSLCPFFLCYTTFTRVVPPPPPPPPPPPLSLSASSTWWSKNSLSTG